MLAEILEQPAALARTLKAQIPAVKKLQRALAARRPSLIVLAARGTSDNAAQFARYLLEIETGIPVSLAAPSINTLYGAQVNLANALVVAISQSGESTDTNFVLESAKKQGAMTVGITNEAGSTLANLADHVLLVRAGKERSVAATKTYTGQLLSVYHLAYALGARFTLENLERIPDLAAAALTLEPEVTTLAARTARIGSMAGGAVCGSCTASACGALNSITLCIRSFPNQNSHSHTGRLQSHHPARQHRPP